MNVNAAATWHVAVCVQCCAKWTVHVWPHNGPTMQKAPCVAPHRHGPWQSMTHDANGATLPMMQSSDAMAAHDTHDAAAIRMSAYVCAQ